MSPGQIGFEDIEWQSTPHDGVFVSLLEEVKGSPAPEATAHAVRLDPNCEIGLHYHQREENWTELLLFPNGGDFEFQRGDQLTKYSTLYLVYERMNPREVYGMRNKSHLPLYFFSIMKPGFTGFQEIIEV